MNFHPDNPHRVSATPQQRMMQLKVRMQSIVRGLVALEMPPPHITSFLSGLIADDNYFSANFLFAFEHAQLDFNTYQFSSAFLRSNNFVAWVGQGMYYRK